MARSNKEIPVTSIKVDIRYENECLFCSEMYNCTWSTISTHTGTLLKRCFQILKPISKIIPLYGFIKPD